VEHLLRVLLHQLADVKHLLQVVVAQQPLRVVAAADCLAVCSARKAVAADATPVLLSQLVEHLLHVVVLLQNLLVVHLLLAVVLLIQLAVAKLQLLAADATRVVAAAAADCLPSYSVAAVA